MFMTRSAHNRLCFDVGTVIFGIFFAEILGRQSGKTSEGTMIVSSEVSSFLCCLKVSCTVTFSPEKESADLANALNYFQYQLKGVSFLPRLEMGAYAQMPYERISESTYNDMCKNLKVLVLDKKLSSMHSKEILPVPDKFCDSDSCATITLR